MVTIRLRRTGKKKQPSYRLIVSERGKDTTGTYLELLGTYNPRVQPSTLTLNVERVKYWLEKGAYCSDTIHNLFIDQKVILGQKRKNVAKSKKTEAAKEEAAAAEAPKAETPTTSTEPEKSKE